MLFFIFFSFAFSLTSKHNLIKKRIKNNSVQKVTLACSLCTNSFNGISGMIQDGFSEDDIIVQLISHCSIYDSAVLQKACNEIGSTYVPLFMTIIQNDPNPDFDELCLKLGFCNLLE